MNKSKKIKLYTYHGRHIPIKLETGQRRLKILAKIADRLFDFFYSTGLMVLNFIQAAVGFLILACFHTGSLIVNSASKTFSKAKNDFVKTKGLWPKRFSLLWQAQYAKTLLLFLGIIGAAWAGVGSLHLIAKGIEIKNKIVNSAFLGNSYLSQAKDALAAQDFGQAQNRFGMAYQAFSRGQAQIKESGEALNQLLNLVPQKRDADRLLEAASLVAQAGQDSITFQQQAKNIKLSAAGINAVQGQTTEIFARLEDVLNQSLQKISRAAELVGQVGQNNLPKSNREAFVDLKSKLFAAQLALSNFKDVFDLSKNFLLGNKTVLILFENNNELRASGGFIGTFGALKMRDGNINKIQVSSVYDLDGQIREKIKPPMPILSINDRWFLRDANWFADFPSSAKKVSNFYELEGGETPDLIIAVTPNIIVDWLKITGPVSLPKYGVVLNADNFIEQTQAITTLSNDLPTNEPKQILADLFPLLLQKISAVEASQWPQVIQSLQDNLSQKQIVVYAKDPNLQKQLAAFHWDGGIQDADRDYLSVVSSNLGGTKTDLAMDQQVNLTTTIGEDGSVTNELLITRTNKMPDLPQTKNSDFLRVYVPLDSKLVNNIGFDYKKLNYPDSQKYKIDGDVYEWQKNSVTDNLTGTIIGRESGKTFFGNWLELKGGESRTVKLVYRLPFRLADVDRYSLLVQKQIGAQNNNFNWAVNFSERKIEWKNFDANSLDTSSLASGIILNKDYFFGLVFGKR